MRWKCVCLLSGQREKHCFFLTNIPIPHRVKIEVANVIAFNSAYFFPVLVDLTPDKVLLAEVICAEVVIPHQTVNFISEGDLSCQLMIHCAHENSTQVVIVLVPTDF